MSKKGMESSEASLSSFSVEKIQAAMLNVEKGSVVFEDSCSSFEALGTKNEELRERAKKLFSSISAEELSKLWPFLSSEAKYGFVNFMGVQAEKVRREILRGLGEEETGQRLHYLKILEIFGRELGLRPHLHPLLQDPDQKVRASVVQLLGMIGDTRDIFHLMQCLYDKDQRVKANAIEALELLGTADLVWLLGRFLMEPNNRVRANAIKAIYKTGEKTVLKFLEDMLKSKDKWSRSSAVWVLGELGSPTAEELLDLVRDDPDPDVQRNIQRVLEKLKTTEGGRN